MSTVRIAMVSPHSVRGQEERANLDRAVQHIADAAAQGAQFVCFPEGYPGPYNGPMDYSPLPALSAAAREHGVYVIAGMLEAAEDLGPEIYRLAFKLINPSGEVIGSHSRVLPNPKEMNEMLMGGKCIAPGDSLEVFPTEHGTVGILVCSEAWSPELPLIMALKGADILFAPIGGAVYELHDHWQTVLKARAYENTMYVATCQNMWGMEDSMGLIVGPDGVIAQSTDPGELIGDLDIDRLAVLREQTQDLKLPKPYRSIPGMLKHRRPDLYEEILAPRDDAYDFFYFKKS
ncbi:MAG: 5-aminopentanamidase [Thermoleophilales bacterium]|jgi:predicted amidohydrolase|nr:5-aminopentanamidase [Thermoleophilales bacterium]